VPYKYTHTKSIPSQKIKAKIKIFTTPPISESKLMNIYIISTQYCPKHI